MSASVVRRHKRSNPRKALPSIIRSRLRLLYNLKAGRRDLLFSIGALCCLWLGLVKFGWARWGDVTVDCGRELYVAAALAEGKMLYRDVWYLYGPGAPYLNSLLFRTFGIHLNVVYFAGSLAGLAAMLTLFRCALYFAPLSVAFAIGYIVLIQSFGGGFFNYPLPYAYASVYGSVAAYLFLLYAIRGALNPTKTNLLWAGIWSAVALITKLEFGFACFGSLAVLQVGLILQQRSWRTAFRNLSAVTPALLICAVVIAWMVSIGGVAFITQENLMSWPTSYFMRQYGQNWLRLTGYDLSLAQLMKALVLTVGFVAFWVGFRFWLLSVFRKLWLRAVCIGTVLGAGTVALLMEPPKRFDINIALLVFPRPMVFIVALAIPLAGFLFWRSRLCARRLAILVVMIFGPLLAFRILFRMTSRDYAIYYNGPVLLAFFLLLLAIAIPGGHFQNGVGARTARFFVCAAVCGWVTLVAIPPYLDLRIGRVAIESERGTIYVPETILPAWADAANFMLQAKQSGQVVMSIPEDTALYFFAGVPSPTRVFAFTPGTLSPGPMTAKTIAEMEVVPVRFVIWSNRQFFEYGVPEFGVDFDVPFAEYIRRNYRPVREFSYINRPDFWQATLWERKPDK
jgi:hypothetical protein